MGWVTLSIDRDRKVMIAPCGCEFPDTAEGIMQGRDHVKSPRPCRGTKDDFLARVDVMVERLTEADKIEAWGERMDARLALMREDGVAYVGASRKMFGLKP